jgi:hypothetical protein
VFQIGSAHWRCALWSQGYFVFPPVLEGIHLLFYNVGVFSHTTREKLGIFKGWGINPLIAIELTDISHFLLYIAPVGLLLG